MSSWVLGGWGTERTGLSNGIRTVTGMYHPLLPPGQGHGLLGSTVL